MSIEFIPRTTKPEKNNKYYIRKQNGGYSEAIQGSPTDKDCNVLSNCVGYAYGRFNEIGGFGSCKYLKPVNAKNFMDYKGSCKTGMTPKVGSCMVWTNERAGHVAIVEKVINNSEIITSESEWGGRAFYTMTRKKGNGNWGYSGTFLGFIYNPADLEEPTPAPTNVKTYELYVAVPTYNNAADAKNKTNANKVTYGPGIYYVYYKYPTGYSGVYNITTDPTGKSAGAWINPADNVKPTPKPIRKYKVGDIVGFKYIFEKSTTTKKLTPAITQGKITRVLEEDVANPYLIDEGNIGWTNEESIIGLVTTKVEIKPEEEHKQEEVKVEENPVIKEEPKVEEKPTTEDKIKPEIQPEQQDKQEQKPPELEKPQQEEAKIDSEEDEDVVEEGTTKTTSFDFSKLKDILSAIIKIIVALFKKG